MSTARLGSHLSTQLPHLEVSFRVPSCSHSLFLAQQACARDPRLSTFQRRAHLQPQREAGVLHAPVHLENTNVSRLAFCNCHWEVGERPQRGEDMAVEEPGAPGNVSPPPPSMLL